MAWENKIEVNGYGNISVQDVRDSTVIVNFYDRAKKKRLHFIVLSLPASRIATLPILPEGIQISDWYGETIDQWKPFKGKTIIEYLKNAVPREEVEELAILTVDHVEAPKDKRYWAFLQYIKYKTILIVDIISLYFIDNQIIAKYFNDYNIGGCIIVSPFTVPLLEAIKKDVFEYLELYLKDEYLTEQLRDRETAHFSSYTVNVNDVAQLTSAVKNAAFYCLRLKKIDGEEFKDKFSDLR
jgi:hypothetical protein